MFDQIAGLIIRGLAFSIYNENNALFFNFPVPAFLWRQLSCNSSPLQTDTWRRKHFLQAKANTGIVDLSGVIHLPS